MASGMPPAPAATGPSAMRWSALGGLQYFLNPCHTAFGPWTARVLGRWRTGDAPAAHLAGRTCVVTGANAGIGKAAALALARRSAKVHLLCRNRERGAAARAEIARAAQNEAVFLHVVDLASVAEIRAFVGAFEKDHGRVDVLINNAAVMPNALAYTAEGLETALATNVVGFWALTQGLLPLLERARASASSPDYASGRVVNIISGGMFSARMHLPTVESGVKAGHGALDREGYSGIALYALHHRCRQILTQRLAASTGLLVSCCHPGWVETPGLANANDMASFYSRMKWCLRTPEEGADTAVWLAAAPQAASVEQNGLYWFDRRPRPAHKPLAGTSPAPEEAEALEAFLNELLLTV